MLVDMGIAWRLRQRMAERNMWLTTELHAALAEYASSTGGRTWSRPQIYRIVTGRPDRLSLDLLDALCGVLDCEPADLLVRTERGGS